MQSEYQTHQPLSRPSNMSVAFVIAYSVDSGVISSSVVYHLALHCQLMSALVD